MCLSLLTWCEIKIIWHIQSRTSYYIHSNERRLLSRSVEQAPQKVNKGGSELSCSNAIGSGHPHMMNVHLPYSLLQIYWGLHRWTLTRRPCSSSNQWRDDTILAFGLQYIVATPRSTGSHVAQGSICSRVAPCAGRHGRDETRRHAGKRTLNLSNYLSDSFPFNQTLTYPVSLSKCLIFGVLRKRVHIGRLSLLRCTYDHATESF